MVGEVSGKKSGIIHEKAGRNKMNDDQPISIL